MFIASVLASSYPLWWLAQIIAIAILVILFLRWRPGFLSGKTVGETLGAALDARKGQIEEQLAAAERSRQEAARIREQSAQDVARAREEAEGIVSRAAETSQAIQKDIEARAHEEYDRIVGQARNEIESERRQAELALRRRAADIVVDAAQQIVERHLDDESDQRLIQESVSHLGNGSSR